MERSQSKSKTTTIGILYIPPYFENNFASALDQFSVKDEQIEYQIFTIEKKAFHPDLNRLLNMCRTIISEEKDIQMLFTDSLTNHLIIGKLVQEYPRIRSGGAHFISTLQWLDRSSTELSIPTLTFPSNESHEENWSKIEQFLQEENLDGYVKSIFPNDFQLTSFRFSSKQMFYERIEIYKGLFDEQYNTCLQSLFNIYLSPNQTLSNMKSNYLIQPFFDLVRYPHWRLVIANACIYDQDIILWPLADGYSGWPFLSQRPLAILPILVCPSQHLSIEQQNLLYTHFRQDLNRWMSQSNIRFGWIECSYFISCSNDIHLISIKPKCSVYLIEAFHVVCQYGHPINALVQLSNRQRPPKPILNGTTVYIHRLWTKNEEHLRFGDLINFVEIQRLHRLKNSCHDRYVRLRFHADDLIESKTFTEVGFIQVSGEYFQIGLANLIECRSMILKRSSSFPFAHRSMLDNHPDEFDSETCLPSTNLLETLKQIRQNEGKDLV